MKTLLLCCSAIIMTTGCKKTEGQHSPPAPAKPLPSPMAMKSTVARAPMTPAVMRANPKKPATPAPPRKPPLRAVETLPDHHLPLTPDVLALMKRVNDLIVPGTPRDLHVELAHDLVAADRRSLPAGVLRFRYGLPQFDDKNRIYAVGFELHEGAVGKGKEVHLLFPERDSATKKLRLRYDKLSMKRYEEIFLAYRRRTFDARMKAMGEPPIPPEFRDALKNSATPGGTAARPVVTPQKAAGDHETSGAAGKTGTPFPIPALPREDQLAFTKNTVSPTPATMKRLNQLGKHLQPGVKVMLRALLKKTLGADILGLLPSVPGTLTTPTPLKDDAGRTIALCTVFIPEALKNKPATSKATTVLLTFHFERGEKSAIDLTVDSHEIGRYIGDVVLRQIETERRLANIALLVTGTAWLAKDLKGAHRKVKAHAALFWYGDLMQSTITYIDEWKSKSRSCDVVEKSRLLWRRTKARDLVLVHQALRTETCATAGTKSMECSRHTTFYLYPRDRHLRFFTEDKDIKVLAITNPHLAADLKEIEGESAAACTAIAF